MAKKKTAPAVADVPTGESPLAEIPVEGGYQPAPPSIIDETPSTNGSSNEPAPTTTASAPPRPPAEHSAGGNGDKRHPVYKVGPIATDRDNSVEAAVWDRVIQTRDGREFTVYSVTVQANWRDADGSWKKSNNFRGSQVYALVYCLQRCSDWILAQRDPAGTCPF